MATIQKNTNVQNTQDFIRVQDLFYLCVGKWQWFVISLVLCLTVATIYLLRTPPVYTRSASILIKDDSKGGSTSADISSFADLGLVSVNTNVNNEIGALQSPDLIREVVKRLHLNLNYQVDGRFHMQTIYGETLPVKASLLDLSEEEYASFLLDLSADGSFSLSDFVRGEEKEKGEWKGRLNDTILSPLGRMVIVPTEYFKAEDIEIEVVSSALRPAVSAVAGSLTVTQDDEKSSIIALSYNDVSPQRAEDVLNMLIAVYNENWVREKNQIAVSTSIFINERLGVIEGELGNVDNDISSFKSRHLLPDVQAVASMYMAQASEADATVKTLNNQLYMARYIRNYVTSEASLFQLLPANSGLEEDHSLSTLISEYNSKLLERNNLVSKSSVKNPLVVEMDAQLVALRGALVSSLDNQLVALEAQIKSLKKYGGQATSQIASNPKQAKYLLSVERQQKVKESLYLYLLQKREENELSQAFTAYNTRVITTPQGSMIPTAPLKKNILLVAFALGLLIPMVIIFIQENTNTVVRGRKDLENISAPIVGEIPQYFTSKRKWFFYQRVKPDVKIMVVKEGSRNIINEAFRVLRSNIDFMVGKQKEQNVFVFTSFNPGSGKSFLTMNIAKSFAIKKKQILVIDGDLRHGSSSEYVDMPEKGLSDYLGGLSDDWRSTVMAHESNAYLHVLPIGKVPPNPTELLESDRLATLIEQARGEYDFIFIDCPPIDILADTQIIEKVADRTLFVIRAGLLDRSMLPELEKIYQEKRFKNFAVILNATENTGSRYGSRYGYRYGYHYGNASYYGPMENGGG